MLIPSVAPLSSVKIGWKGACLVPESVCLSKGNHIARRRHILGQKDLRMTVRNLSRRLTGGQELFTPLVALPPRGILALSSDNF